MELEKKQPHNYKGHAISTSDVMILNDNGITTVYYVNKDAFIEISDFMKVASSENGGLTKDTVGYEIEGKGRIMGSNRLSAGRRQELFPYGT